MRVANVTVVTPIYERPTAEFLWSLLHLEGRGGFIMCKGVLLENARRLLVDQALRLEGMTHVLMVDADVQFPPDALTRLLAHNAPVVGGVYRARNPPHHPLVYGSDHNVLYLTDAPKIPSHVGALPCGFMLVARQVFLDVGAAHTWFAPMPEFEPDLSFCKRVTSADYKILCDPTIPLGHVAETVLLP